MYEPFSWLRLEAIAQASIRKMCRYSTSIDYIGSSSVTNLTVSNIGKNTGKLDLSYMESISPRWTMGTELRIDNENLAHRTAFALKYSLNTVAFAMTLSPREINLSYWRQISDRLQLATNYEYNHKSKKFLCCIMYQYEFPNACIRGQFGSDLLVGFTYNL